jgi:hypothetical protein
MYLCHTRQDAILIGMKLSDKPHENIPLPALYGCYIFCSRSHSKGAVNLLRREPTSSATARQ